MAVTTLLDIATMNGSDQVVGLVEESVKAHPELTRGYARTIKGIHYKTLVRTAVPTVAFRNANEGVVATKSTFENRLFETYIMNPRWECDRAVADAHEDGAQALIAIEGLGQMEGAMRTLASQFYYGTGTGGDAKGFPGLIGTYDATNMVVDAGGTTAATGSSVWAVRFGVQDVGWLWGNNGSLTLDPVKEQRVTDGGGNPYTAYVQELLARPGLQQLRSFSVGRIKKLTEDTGKGLTDALLGRLFAKFPVGFPPDVLFMTRRSREQLRASRTATNPTGAPAPTPTDWEGTPIAVTDAILDTEALTL